MNKVQNKIYKMITENTGTHFLDSGMDSNRNWQRNQKKTIEDFINEPEQTYEVMNTTTPPPEIIRTVSVFHYLAGQGSNLELDSICNQFNKLNKNFGDSADCEPYGVGVDAWEYLKEYINEEKIRVFIMNEYLSEYMDSYALNDELEYINEFTDYYDENIIYKSEQAEEIKQAIINN